MAPVVARVVLEVVEGQPVRGVAFFDSCWVVPAILGVRLTACAPLGYLLCTISWNYIGCRDNHYDDNHRLDRSRRCDDSCCFGDSYYCGDSRLLDDSRNRGYSHRCACSRHRGSSHPPNRGCCPDTYCGAVAYRYPWELVWRLFEVV